MKALLRYLKLLIYNERDSLRLQAFLKYLGPTKNNLVRAFYQQMFTVCLKMYLKKS